MPANVENMFYVGDIPWHREGVPLQEPPDTKTAIIAAGLNWRVDKVNLYAEGSGLVQNYYGIMRSDNHEVLGVVGKDYEPLQNVDAFKFFDPLVNKKIIEYETAGSLGKGEIIWVLAKLKENGEFKIKKDDTVRKYLLLSNSHDGNSAISVKFTPIRVVCQNTLTAALSEGETTRIKHITSMYRKLDVQLLVENIMLVYQSIEGKFKEMAQHKMSRKKLNQYFNSIYPVIDIKDVKTVSQMDKREINIGIQNQLIRNFEEGFGVKELGIGGTLWAAYNAVTQHVDHPVNYKLGNNKLLKRIWFGDGEAIKKKAYVNALQFLKSA